MRTKNSAPILALLALGATSFTQQATPDAIFQRADKNHDGKVTPDELPNTETFARFDLNKDGVITLEEGRKVLGSGAVAEAIAASPTGGEQIFKYLDKNGDGVLTEDELPQQARRLKALDQDKDGRITRAEALETLARFRNLFGALPAAAEAGPMPSIVTGPRVVKGGDVGVGRQWPDLAFKTRDGQAHRLSEWGAQKGVVVAMTSATCPVSKRYAPALARLEQELAAQGIAFLFVDPMASENAEVVDAFVKEHGFTAPLLHDTDKSFATAVRARTTTEVFLLDPTRTLLYRGALDDQYGLNYNLDAPRERYLLDAVTALLAGTRPQIAATEPPGCELDLPVGKSAPVTDITYHRDVARILQQNCVQCHHDGGIAPFALDDPAEVKDRAKVIRRVVEQRQMPPWFAAPIADGVENPWANDCSLSTRDKTDLLAWLASTDRPLGDAKDAPAPLKFPSEWSIGTPDLVVQIPRPIAIKAEGFMPYQFATAQTTLTEDKWVVAYEVQPSVREAVHHVIIQVHEKGAKVRDRDEGAGGFFAAYVPGNASRVYAPGFARKLPAGSTVSFQIHYTPFGRAVEEQVRMGLVFAKEPPKFEVKTLSVADHQLAIPPGAADHVESTERPVPFDVHVLAYVAHMHVRGKSFRYDLILPDGKKETLLDIPHYDFNWQLRYEYKEPRVIPRGSQMKVTAVYDNSPANKANPDPTKLVKWGPQTYDEMMIGYIEYFVPIAPTVAAK
jgi:Ca2+-binding EF-hand superfamily protein/peroxiredoxin/mono/diheme cytochrome c family protein